MNIVTKDTQSVTKEEEEILFRYSYEVNQLTSQLEVYLRYKEKWEIPMEKICLLQRLIQEHSRAATLYLTALLEFKYQIDLTQYCGYFFNMRTKEIDLMKREEECEC